MIGVVIVTYADRRNLLKEVINKLFLEDAVSVIYVVGNNTPYSLFEYIKTFQSPKIQFNSFSTNTGSANGYKFGIQQLEKIENIQYIWLLDDDNLPSTNASTVLLAAGKKNKNAALIPLRKDRTYLLKASQGFSTNFLFPQKNSFLGFHIFYFLQKKIYFQFAKMNEPSQEIVIPMCPYGGLFFNKELLKSIGYPDERFFLYGDDIEYTYRITKNGYKIILLSKIIIEDIDNSWVNKQTTPGLKYLQQNDFRAWFSVRNSAYYSRNSLKNSNFVFGLNKNIYLLSLAVISFFLNKRNEFAMFKEMVQDGLEGNFDNEKILNRGT